MSVLLNVVLTAVTYKNTTKEKSFYSAVKCTNITSYINGVSGRLVKCTNIISYIIGVSLRFCYEQ